MSLNLPAENRPDWTTNVQWKGTDLCMDFWCPACGQYSHIVGFFMDIIDCDHCYARFEMPTDLPLKRVVEANVG